MKHGAIILIAFLCSGAVAAQTTEELVTRGLRAHENSDYNTAVELFSKAIDIDPLRAEIWYNRGNSKVAMGLHSAAIVDFNKAIYLDTGITDAYYNRAICFGETGNFQFAIADLNTYLSRVPGELAAIAERATICTEAKEFDLAFQDLGVLRRSYPEDTEYRKWWLQLGILSGRNQECLDTLDVWISAEPGYAFWHYRSALLNTDMGNFQKSLDHIQICQLTDPDFKELKHLKAENYFYLGRFDEASDIYSALLMEDSLNSDLLADYGHCLLQMHMYNEADSVLTKSIRSKNSSPAYAYLGRGIARFNLAMYQAACDDWNKSKMLGENRAEKYLLENCTKEKTGN